MRWLVLAVGLGLALTGSAKDRFDCKWTAPHTARVTKLRLPDGVAARIARADVAHLGTAALSALGQVYVDRDVPSDRVRPVVSAMLVESVELRVLRARPILLALLDDDVKRARAVAAPLFAAKRYDSGSTGMLPPGAKPPYSAARNALKALTERGGAAVVVAIELTKHPQPAQRLFGVEVLVRLGALGQRPTLDRLRKTDRGRVHVSQGCVVEPTTVGAMTGRWLKRFHPFATPKASINAACLEAERYLRWVVPEVTARQRNALINRLRQEGTTLSATSFADYWRRATPILKGVIAKARPRNCRCRRGRLGRHKH